MTPIEFNVWLILIVLCYIAYLLNEILNQNKKNDTKR